MEDVTIRRAKPDDFSHIFKIECDCFSKPWSENSIKESIESQSCYFVVATIKNNAKEEICGFGSYNFCLDEGYINNIAVLPSYQKKGIGKKFLNSLEKQAKNKNMSFLSLEVRKSNKNAISLYKKNGYRECGIRKNFYENPCEDAIIMTKEF